MSYFMDYSSEESSSEETITENSLASVEEKCKRKTKLPKKFNDYIQEEELQQKSKLMLTILWCFK